MLYGIVGFLIGVAIYFAIRVGLTGFYTVRPDERAVLTSFGRAKRLGTAIAAPDGLTEDERARYRYPQVEVVGPGGPYFKWPWQRVHKVSVATEAVALTWDPTKSQSTIEAVTKDNLTTGHQRPAALPGERGQPVPVPVRGRQPARARDGLLRLRVLRERVANFVDPKGENLLGDEAGEEGGVDLSEGVSINDLRKNLPLLNQFMEEQCRSTPGRYGIELEAVLITEIDPPHEVDQALSAINSTRNQVAADISTARADSEQQITMSKRAVEIARNNAEAEVAPLRELSTTLGNIKSEAGSPGLAAYVRNMRVALLSKTRRIVLGADSSSQLTKGGSRV